MSIDFYDIIWTSRTIDKLIGFLFILDYRIFYKFE